MTVAAQMDDVWSGHVDTRTEPATKPIDFTYLRRFTLGNKDLEREVLYLFAESAPGYLKALENACTPKEWHDAAHTLKGSARAVGAWRVARTAEVAEKLRFDIDRDRRAFAIDSAYEAGEEALRYVLAVFPR
jgi:Hpt domain